MQAAPFFTARLEPTGEQFDAWPDRSLLQSAEEGQVPWPSSCRNGTCRACLCQLLSGQVAYRIAWPGLSAQEKADKLILPCAAYPLSDLVIAPAG